MSRRSSAPTSGQGQHPQAAPPASPLGEAAAAAASQPLPVPDARTDRGALEGATRWLPGALQPAGMLLVGAAKAVWTAAVPLAHLAWRLLVWSSPVLIWAFWKWVNWYLLGFLSKAQRILKWGAWLLSLLTKAAPAPPA